MSYSWFQHQRHLYPQVAFPGTHLTGKGSQDYLDGGFCFKEFVDANIDLSLPIYEYARDNSTSIGREALSEETMRRWEAGLATYPPASRERYSPEKSAGRVFISGDLLFSYDKSHQGLYQLLQFGLTKEVSRQWCISLSAAYCVTCIAGCSGIPSTGLRTTIRQRPNCMERHERRTAVATRFL